MAALDRRSEKPRLRFLTTCEAHVTLTRPAEFFIEKLSRQHQILHVDCGNPGLTMAAEVCMMNQQADSAKTYVQLGKASFRLLLADCRIGTQTREPPANSQGLPIIRLDCAARPLGGGRSGARKGIGKRFYSTRLNEWRGCGHCRVGP